ncbi:MAG: hypothetical protein QX189_12535 [Methylococcales bacterium]
MSKRVFACPPFRLPIHKNEDLKVGLLKHFMKVAGISETEL